MLLEWFPARFHEAVVSSRSRNRCAPRQGLHIGTWVARPRHLRPVAHVPSADAAALEGVPQSETTRLEDNVTYVDRTLSCVDCGVEFIHSAADQEYYVQKGFVSDPKRCTSCRASRRASRDAGYDVRDIGGPRGYERGDDRPTREYFAVLCSSCGNQAQVRSSRAWTARSTAPTASGRSARLTGSAGRARGGPAAADPARATRASRSREPAAPALTGSPRNAVAATSERSSRAVAAGFDDWQSTEFRVRHDFGYLGRRGGGFR